MKQKQDLSSALFVIFFIVMLAFTGLIISKINLNVNNNIQKNEYGLDDSQLNTLNGLNNTISSSFDVGILIALILAFLVVAITSLLAEANPLFFIFGLVYYIGSLIVIPIAANIYIKIHNLTTMEDVATLLPMTNLVMQNYVLICVLMTSVVLALLYMRSRA